jgi:guanine deaminase
MSTTAVRGTFFDFTDDPWKHVGNEKQAARFLADGLLVVTDGIIDAFGPYDELAPRYSGVETVHVKDRIIVPGFIDGHIHLPQTRMLGAYGEQLLPWLQKWVYPEETKYKDRDYAREGTRRFFDALLAAGTTTFQAFTNASPVATEELFEEAGRRNMRVISGLTGIDRNAPADFIDTPENFYRDSKRLIEQYHRKGRNLYAITPRFAFGASPQLLDACRRLKAEHPDCWVNTHISENPSECRRISEKGASVVFCPCSNLFLGSGLFRLGRATDPEYRVRMSFGTDMGGGNRFSMINVLDEAYKVGMCNNTLLDGSIDPVRKDVAEAERNKLSPYRGFWSITLGGAEGLYLDDKLGNFEPGKEADFVVLDPDGGQLAQPWHQSLSADGGSPRTIDDAAELLFGVMMVGDDRCVDETWVMGKRLYKKP